MAKTLLQEIAARVAKKNGITIKAAEGFVSSFFSVIKEGLEADKQVKVRGLGTFKIIAVKPRESINVNTGERVLIEGHDKITFTPDSSMKELVNRPFSQFDTVELEDGVEFSDIPNELDPSQENVAEETAKEETPDVIAEEPIKATETQEEEEKEVVAEEPVKANEPEEAEELEAPEVNTKEEETEQIKAEPEQVEEEPEQVEKEPETVAAIITPLVSEPHTKIVEQTETTEQEASVTNVNPKVAEEKTIEAEEETIEPKEERANDEPATEDEETKKKNTPWIMIAAFAALFIVGVTIGWWLSHRNSTSEAEPQQIAATDSLDNDSVKTQTVTAAKEDYDGIDYEKLNADPRVKYGAYTIEGIDTIVTLRPGQTMESYCRATLGSNMLCYFQALNDTTELSGGDTMKVPKVKVKAKGK